MRKNKIIEQGFIYADSTVKEMTDFFQSRGEDLGSKEEKKKLQQLPRKSRIKSPPRKQN